jgi:dynein heavy chain 2
MQAMQVAGVEMDQVYLLVEDHQLVEPNFLDMLNSLLSAGEVRFFFLN